jgi:glycosyltransferase involved in cell wall biosynthesis
MRVGFGVTNLLRGEAISGVDGIGTYTRELYKGLENAANLNLIPFSTGEYEYDKSKFGTVIQTRVLPVELALASFSSRFSFENRLDVEELDMIHATDHMIPIARDVPLVSTIMDAIPITNPEWLNVSPLAKLKRSIWVQVAKRSDLIITISNYSKKSIAASMHIDSDKICVVPLGVSRSFFERCCSSVSEEILNKYALNKGQFFLNVGTLQPRKNVIRLLNAMKRLPSAIRVEFPLVLVGKYGWGGDELLVKIGEAQEEGWCHWIKRVPDLELKVLLQSATAMVFPSLAEGFGLPVLEAFASKTPVITSNTSSLVEVAAGHAWLVDPMSIASISEALQQFVICGRSLAVEERLETGFLHAKAMSWEQSAHKTHDVYRSLLE